MSSSSDEESEDGLEEPQLKYERIGNDFLEILKKDAASCIALHEKFIALGTHWGIIHILDHQGNNNTNKQFTSHHSTITCIALDESGDFIASCSDGGIVSVCGLYTDEYNQTLTLDQPVKAVALEPGFANSSSKQLVYGTDKLMLSERSWLRRIQRSVPHHGDGLVRTIKWKGQFIAWANDVGINVYDMKQQCRITFISRSRKEEHTDFRPELYPAHIAWKDNTTFLVGWATDIKVCAIQEKISREANEPSKFCVILHGYRTDFFCCGLAPFCDQVVALSYTEPKKGTTSSPRPQLRILESNPEDKNSFIEVSRDALSVRGYQSYRCNDYSLEFNSSELFVVSPKDIVLAQKRDPDDRVTWLLQIKHFEEALEAVKSYGKALKKHSYSDVGLEYLFHLVDTGCYGKAAASCAHILGNKIRLWEQLVDRFNEVGQLAVIASSLPIGDYRLPSAYYGMVLTDFLNKDHKGFADLLRRWPNELYDIPSLTSQVKICLDKDSHNPELSASLAKLYEADHRYDLALRIYLRIQHPDTFKLIRQHELFKDLQENVLPLMQFGGYEAVDLLLDHMEFVPIDKVVAELEHKPSHLHMYLHALFQRDSHLGSDYHVLQVRLYAEFDRPKLLPFLKSSTYIQLEKAFEICKERDYVKEQVFLLVRMGNASKALDLITEHEPDVSKAVEFCKEQNDARLWDELINKSIHRPQFIRGLLENIGTHVDPIILIKKIPQGMNIPGLRDALVKILQDYSMQTALWWECKRILSSDVVSLMRKQKCVNTRAQRIDDERVCDACGRPLLLNTGSSRLELPAIVSFLCQHAFHDGCITVNNRDKCSTCRGKIRQTFSRTWTRSIEYTRDSSAEGHSHVLWNEALTKVK